MTFVQRQCFVNITFVSTFINFCLSNFLFNRTFVLVKGMVNILDFFPQRMFWEYHAEDLSIEEDKELIIERVLNRSLSIELLKNLRILDSLYKREQIIEVALGSSEIYGNETIEIIATYYGLNPREFYQYIS